MLLLQVFHLFYYHLTYISICHVDLLVDNIFWCSVLVDQWLWQSIVWLDSLVPLNYFLWHMTDCFVSAFSLPWQGLKAATKKQKYDKIREKKVSTPIEVCILTWWICFCIHGFSVKSQYIPTWLALLKSLPPLFLKSIILFLVIPFFPFSSSCQVCVYGSTGTGLVE